ncbi:MAG: DUF418 domain-containing protein [Desulfobacteraceae bacterium]|nr:MAG: DUF418 domain-containing protein [Desulfobacteraceae bacterium]
MKLEATRKANRIEGYDMARGIAVLGMLVMNFKLVMLSSHAPAKGFWGLILQGMEGRFAVLFIILAGIGVSLMTRRARAAKDPALIRQKQKTLGVRAIFLLVVGLLFLPVWEADILHYYGIFMTLAAMVLHWPDHRLKAMIITFVLMFNLMFLLFDWGAGWDFTTLSYHGLWTLNGFIRHTLFNGFHPVFPWFAFFLFGMVVGRQDLSAKNIRIRALWVSSLVFCICEAVSYGVPALIQQGQIKTVVWFFSTLSFPPFPLFIISGCSSGLMVIMICIMIAEKAPQWFTRPWVCTGQMVLTHYMAHIILGMGLLEGLDMLYHQPLSFAVVSAVVYFVLSMIFSVFWLGKFQKGPLEMLMRRISG